MIESNQKNTQIVKTNKMVNMFGNHIYVDASGIKLFLFHLSSMYLQR